jgi:hypothetical protein
MFTLIFEHFVDTHSLFFNLDIFWQRRTTSIQETRKLNLKSGIISQDVIYITTAMKIVNIDQVCLGRRNRHGAKTSTEFALDIQLTGLLSKVFPTSHSTEVGVIPSCSVPGSDRDTSPHCTAACLTGKALAQLIRAENSEIL